MLHVCEESFDFRLGLLLQRSQVFLNCHGRLLHIYFGLRQAGHQTTQLLALVNGEGVLADVIGKLALLRNLSVAHVYGGHVFGELQNEVSALVRQSFAQLLD